MIERKPYLWWWAAQITVFLVAIGNGKELKDITDSLQWQKFDLLDIAATQAGGLTAMFLLLFLQG